MAAVSQLLESRRARIGRWAGAALVVCALHAGGLLALMHWREEETSDDTAGAMTVELALVPGAARVDSPPGLAHGPVQQQAKLTPQASRQAAEEVKDIPRVDPSQAAEPEVALPRPRPAEKEPSKEKEPQEVVPEKRIPQQDDAVPLTTAPPRVEAEAARRSAPSPEQAASLARVRARWQNSLLSKVNRYKRYPAAADRRGIKGIAVVRFRIDRSGNVISSEIMRSSGSPILDAEALALLKRVSPLPPPPEQLDEPMLDIALPIGFGMKPDR